MKLLDCSRFLKIKQISVHSKDYIEGITLTYRLPAGQEIKSEHSINSENCLKTIKTSKTDPRENYERNKNSESFDEIFMTKTISLKPQEFINDIRSTSNGEGLTRLELSTTHDNKIIISGKLD